MYHFIYNKIIIYMKACFGVCLSKKQKFGEGRPLYCRQVEDTMSSLPKMELPSLSGGMWMVLH